MKMKDIIIYLSIIIVLIAIDQLTKYIAFKYLPYNTDCTCIPHLFRLHTYTNDGAMFGILSGKFWLFYIFTFVGLGVFGYMLRYGNISNYPFYTFGLLLMIAGTIGNFIDRVAFQSVRDFLTFDFFEFAIFNFADMCMTCGIVVLAIDIIFSDIGAQWK